MYFIPAELKDNNIKIKYWDKDSKIHTHDFFEMTYVLKGTIFHSLNGGNPEPIHAGQYIFLDYGNYHKFEINDALIINLAFNSYAISEKAIQCLNIYQLFALREFSILNTVDIPFPDAKILTDDGTILKLLELIISETASDNNFSGNILKSYLIALLLHIIKPYCKNYNANISPLTAKAIAIINKHFADSNPLTIAAKELNYSPASLSLLFQKDFGKTFKEYLQQYRINQARYLLESTNMKVSAISPAVGYQDQKFFTQIFKELTGQTPSQYRKKQALPSDIPITAL